MLYNQTNTVQHMNSVAFQDVISIYPFKIIIQKSGESQSSESDPFEKYLSKIIQISDMSIYMYLQ